MCKPPAQDHAQPMELCMRGCRMKVAFLFNLMLMPPRKYHGTCTHFGMIWQFGFENLWLSRASSMHNNNNNKKLQGASLVAVRWVGEIRWSSLLSYLAIMYQSIPSLTIPPRQSPREFFEMANSPPSQAQRQCEIPTPGTEKLC